MPTGALTIWCNSTFQESALALLQQGTLAHRLAFPRQGASATDALAEAEVAFGQPDPAAILASERLRWVHLTSAGYTRYDRDDLREALKRRGAILTNSSHVYDEPCAQHALAMMLALARQLPQAHESQRTDREWRTGERRAGSFLLGGQTVLLLGFGAIARRLAELLAPFHLRVVGVRRAPRGDEGIEMVAESDLERVLPEADHVVNILPESDATRGYIHAGRLARMKRGAFFYNIGRGATVDQEALIAALQSQKLAAAYLDVTDPEPLPPDHPLWSAPNCFITPHSAGGHADEDERLVRHFLANLTAFEKGEPLTDRVV